MREASARPRRDRVPRDASPSQFQRVAIWSHYHAQIAFYRQAARRGAGDRAELEGWIIAVESKPPHAVVCYRLARDVLEAGERLCDRWVEEVLACESGRRWSGYSDAAVDLAMPEERDGFVMVVDESEAA